MTYIEPLINVLWLAGLIARAAEAGGVIWWPWPWGWERRSVDESTRLARMTAYEMWRLNNPGAVLFWGALKWVALLLIIWPVRGLVVLTGWSVFQARLRHQEHYSDNVVPMRRR